MCNTLADKIRSQDLKEMLRSLSLLEEIMIEDIENENRKSRGWLCAGADLSDIDTFPVFCVYLYMTFGDSNSVIKQRCIYTDHDSSGYGPWSDPGDNVSG